MLEDVEEFFVEGYDGFAGAWDDCGIFGGVVGYSHGIVVDVVFVEGEEAEDDVLFHAVQRAPCFFRMPCIQVFGLESVKWLSSFIFRRSIVHTCQWFCQESLDIWQNMRLV